MDDVFSIESGARLGGAGVEVGVGLLKLVGVDYFVDFVFVFRYDETYQHHYPEADE